MTFTLTDFLHYHVWGGAPKTLIADLSKIGKIFAFLKTLSPKETSALKENYIDSSNFRHENN